MNRNTGQRTPIATLSQPAAEETLDPQDWEEIRRLGHRMVDDMMEYLRTVRERPAWQPMPEKVRRSFHQPLPQEPLGATRAYEDFLENVLPYPLGNIHPRFWGWVNGTGSPLTMMAEMLAAAVNPNCGAFDQAALQVENQVLNWLKEGLGYPQSASGIFVSGGSMANMVGLAVGRHAKAGWDMRREGLQGTGPVLTVYASTEAHSSVLRAVELLGFGHDALRSLPVGQDYTMDLRRLEAAIREDRERGFRPVCVVATAGTVNTGATDDLEALADLCAAENIWLHVDGAFGALAALSPKLRPLVRGLDRADSLAFDLHKWVYLPYEAGCILVRDAEIHGAAFAVVPPYLRKVSGGVAADTLRFSDLGIQLSRGFKALKAWMSIKAEGVRKFARLIEQNVAQAAYLARSVQSHPELELLAPVPLNVVCFRYRREGADLERLNALNEAILVRLQEEGTAVPSSTVLQGRFCIRLAITNHRTRREDLDLLVQEVRRLGVELGARAARK